MTILGRDPDGNNIEIPEHQRLRGMYVIGANGTGKTTLIENMIVEDIKKGMGLCVLDPHGDLINNVICRMPQERLDDVILLDPILLAERGKYFGLNLFECHNTGSPPAVEQAVEQVVQIFTKVFGMSSETPRLNQYVRNIAYTFVGSAYTMCEIPLMLLEKRFRERVLRNATPFTPTLFWKTYDTLRPTEQLERSESTLDRIDSLVSNAIIRNIVGQSVTSLHFRGIMDEGKILLVSLSARYESLTSLLGSIIIGQLLTAALSRAGTEKRRQFNLFADEYQRFATPDFATLLTEARKFGIATTIAHQVRGQLDEKNAATALQAGSLICFRLTSEDAKELSTEFDLAPRPGDPIERPVRVFKQEVVQHLLEKGHSDKEVNGCVDEILRPMQDLINRMDKETYRVATSGRMTKDTDLYADGYAYYTFRSHLTEGLAQIDRILVEAMTGKTPPCSDGFKSMAVETMMTLRGYLEIQGGLMDERNEELPLRTGLHELLTRMTDYECSNYKRDILADPPVYRAIKAWNIEELRRVLDRDGKKKYNSEEIEASLKFRSNAESGSISGFLWYLYLLSKKLAEEPIKVDSGKYEQVEGPRQSFADRANEIANELTNLKRGHARSRLPIGEYLLETIVPKTNRQYLEERKERIIKNTIKGYCRSREDIEEEIRRRQGDGDDDEPPPSLTRKHEV